MSVSHTVFVSNFLVLVRSLSIILWYPCMVDKSYFWLPNVTNENGQFYRLIEVIEVLRTASSYIL